MTLIVKSQKINIIQLDGKKFKIISKKFVFHSTFISN